MRLRHPRPQRAGTPTSLCLLRAATFLKLCLCWLTLLPVAGQAQRSATSWNELLATDPGAFGQWLHANRPTPVPAEEKARILASLPTDGEVTDLSVVELTKLAGLSRVLKAAGRDSVYVVKVVDIPQAGMALHARVVLLVSKATFALLSMDELQAFGAHEIAHEYVWDEYAHAIRVADRNRVKELELMCDAIAIVTLNRLGMDSSRLISGIEKISRFNKDRFGTAVNERNYPTVAERRAFAGTIRAWLTRGAASNSTLDILAVRMLTPRVSESSDRVTRTEPPPAALAHCTEPVVTRGAPTAPLHPEAAVTGFQPLPSFRREPKRNLKEPNWRAVWDEMPMPACGRLTTLIS